MLGHFTGYMAGLGECCCHIASVLFYLELWTRQNGKLACTQVKCSWLLPSYVKKVDYAKAKDTNFSSARKLKAGKEKSLNDLSLCCKNDESDHSFTRKKKTRAIRSSISFWSKITFGGSLTPQWFHRFQFFPFSVLLAQLHVFYPL